MDFRIIDSRKEGLPVLAYRKVNETNQQTVVVLCYTHRGLSYEETHQMDNVNACRDFIADFSEPHADRVAYEAKRKTNETYTIHRSKQNSLALLRPELLHEARC